MADFANRKIAVLATDGVEQVELTEPVKALKAAGARGRRRCAAKRSDPGHEPSREGRQAQRSIMISPAFRRTVSMRWFCRAASPTRTRCAPIRRRWRS